MVPPPTLRGRIPSASLHGLRMPARWRDDDRTPHSGGSSSSAAPLGYSPIGDDPSQTHLPAGTPNSTARARIPSDIPPVKPKQSFVATYGCTTAAASPAARGHPTPQSIQNTNRPMHLLRVRRRLAVQASRICTVAGSRHQYLPLILGTFHDMSHLRIPLSTPNRPVPSLF